MRDEYASNEAERYLGLADNFYEKRSWTFHSRTGRRGAIVQYGVGPFEISFIDDRYREVFPNEPYNYFQDALDNLAFKMACYDDPSLENWSMEAWRDGIMEGRD